MRYSLVYSNRAIRDIRKLDPKVKNRIGEILLLYGEDPLNYAVKLKDARLGTYRFRIGDYRVIFDIEGIEIVILRVGHRRDIYKG